MDSPNHHTELERISAIYGEEEESGNLTLNSSLRSSYGLLSVRWSRSFYQTPKNINNFRSDEVVCGMNAYQGNIFLKNQDMAFGDCNLEEEGAGAGAEAEERKRKPTRTDPPTPVHSKQGR